MSRLLTRTLRHHGVTGSLAKSLHRKMSEAPLLQVSIESSIELLLQYRPDDVVSCFKERGNKNMDDLHPLEKNVYALGLLFSGDLEQSLDIQTQVLSTSLQSGVCR